MSLSLISKKFSTPIRSLCSLYQQQNIKLYSSASEWENPKPAPAKYEKSINQVTLLGRVGADPQKRGSAEHPVVVFSLATSTVYDTGDELTRKNQKTDWHRICVFKPSLRDMVYQYMAKGQRVLVQGRISYLDAKDENGEKVPSLTSIIANDITFVSSDRSKGYVDDES